VYCFCATGAEKINQHVGNVCMVKHIKDNQVYMRDMPGFGRFFLFELFHDNTLSSASNIFGLVLVLC
jgi:hypothetical protein